jgi:hypothetical protein
MAWSCPCTAILIIIILFLMVLFFAINFQKFLKFVKYLYPKIQKPSNLIYAEKSIRPVTVIQCANNVSNNKKIQKQLSKTNELSPSLYKNEKHQKYNNLQNQQIGTYLLQNSGN